MTRRTAPAVALGTLVGLVLGAVAYVTVSAGSPDPVSVSRVSSEAAVDPVVLDGPTSQGSVGTGAAAHVARATADDSDDTEGSDDADGARGEDGSGDADDVTAPATSDDEPSARPTADDDSDDHGDDDHGDDHGDDHDEDGDDEDDEDHDDDGDDD